MKAKYWQNKGKFQTQLEQLREKLVPNEGKCKTMHGELLRAISSLYYDVYNNGYCNQEVLLYKKEVFLQYENELKANGLSHEQWLSLKYGFNQGFSRDENRKKCSLYEDAAFVESLDKAVDCIVLYCLAQEESK